MSKSQTVDVLDANGQKAGTAELPAALFDVETNVPLIHQVVVAQLAAARQGTHSTRSRRGSRCGAKPWRQKARSRPPGFAAVLAVTGGVWFTTTAASLRSVDAEEDCRRRLRFAWQKLRVRAGYRCQHLSRGPRVDHAASPRLLVSPRREGSVALHRDE